MVPIMKISCSIFQIRMKSFKLPWQAFLSNWMRGWLKKETGGKKSPGDQNSLNLPVSIHFVSKRRKTLKNCEILLEKKMGEIPRRRWLIWEMEQAICPLLSSLPLLIAPGFKSHYLQRNLWLGFFLQEQIEQGVVLLDATGQTIDEILGKAANAKSKSIRIIKLFKMRCWQQKLGTTWTWSRGRESTTSSPREWSTRCGWTSSAKCQRRQNSKWVVWQAARVRIR